MYPPHKQILPSVSGREQSFISHKLHPGTKLIWLMETVLCIRYKPVSSPYRFSPLPTGIE
jgi:hypothetical protein